jgi:hypothetical protein
MRKVSDYFDFWHAGVSAAAIVAESNMVIAMRLAGFAGMWNVSSGESQRMVSEKLAALQAATLAAAAATMRGATPPVVALAAMKPVRQRTRANVRRLVRRGPGGPG